MYLHEILCFARSCGIDILYYLENACKVFEKGNLLQGQGSKILFINNPDFSHCYDTSEYKTICMYYICAKKGKKQYIK